MVSFINSQTRAIIFCTHHRSTVMIDGALSPNIRLISSWYCETREPATKITINYRRHLRVREGRHIRTSIPCLVIANPLLASAAIDKFGCVNMNVYILKRSVQHLLLCRTTRHTNRSTYLLQNSNIFAILVLLWKYCQRMIICQY